MNSFLLKRIIEIDGKDLKKLWTDIDKTATEKFITSFQFYRLNKPERKQ